MEFAKIHDNGTLRAAVSDWVYTAVLEQKTNRYRRMDDFV